MNPYTKKYLEFEQTEENEKFTDMYKMSKFGYEVYALEEQMKSLQKWIVKDKLEKQEYKDGNFKVVQELYNEKQRRKELNKPFYFITLNPKQDCEFEPFKDAVGDISCWSWVDKCLWVFEQRGSTEEEMGKGFHAHVLISNYNIEKGKLKTQIRNKFKKFCLDIESCINIQQKKREWLNDKLEYIMGKKLDEGKPEKQEIDTLWREKMNLKQFYSFDILTDKRRISKNMGGRREGSGVKKGTKRGKYKCKKNNLHLEDCENKIEIVKKKTTIDF